MAPFSGTVYDLKDNVCIYETTGVKLERIHISSRSSKAARAFENWLQWVRGFCLLLKRMRDVQIKIWIVLPEKFSPFVINGTEKTDNRKTAAES